MHMHMSQVILSTNVAETSLTIDDVTMVVDSGRVKEASYDALNGAGQLLETWAARALDMHMKHADAHAHAFAVAL